jgi:hypothetical protein
MVREGNEGLPQVKKCAPEQKEPYSDLHQWCQAPQKRAPAGLATSAQRQTIGTKDAAIVFGDAFATEKTLTLWAAGHRLAVGMVGAASVFEARGVHVIAC